MTLEQIPHIKDEQVRITSFANEIRLAEYDGDSYATGNHGSLSGPSFVSKCWCPGASYKWYQLELCGFDET